MIKDLELIKIKLIDKQEDMFGEIKRLQQKKKVLSTTLQMSLPPTFFEIQNINGMQREARQDTLAGRAFNK